MEKGPRLWHAAASPEPSQVDILEDYCPGSQITSIQVMVVGGLTNNILAPHYVEKEHAEKVSQFITHTRNISTPFVFLGLFNS